MVTEHLGALLSAGRHDEIAGPRGVRLEDLSGLVRLGFPRSSSPAFHDETTAVLRGFGIDVAPSPDEREPIPDVKLASLRTGRCFAMAPPHWSQPLPEDIRRCPVVGDPPTRRTWAVWAAASRRRDVGTFVSALHPPRPE